MTIKQSEIKVFTHFRLLEPWGPVALWRRLDTRFEEDAYDMIPTGSLLTVVDPEPVLDPHGSGYEYLKVICRDMVGYIDILACLHGSRVIEGEEEGDEG